MNQHRFEIVRGVQNPVGFLGQAEWGSLFVVVEIIPELHHPTLLGVTCRARTAHTEGGARAQNGRVGERSLPVLRFVKRHVCKLLHAGRNTASPQGVNDDDWQIGSEIDDVCGEQNVAFTVNGSGQQTRLEGADAHLN